MPPYQVFALDDWIAQYVPKSKITLHDSMVMPLKLKDLQAFDPARKVISDDTILTYAGRQGNLGLRENISLLYKLLDGSTKFDPDNIHITSGTIAANSLVLETLISPGDKVVAQHPTYNPLVEVPRRLGASITLWRQHQQPNGDEFPTFVLDIDELETQLEATKPKLLILNNPSNPTGAILNESQLKRIIEFCSERGILILCDEIFRFLHHDDSLPQPPSILQLNPKNCIVTSSISKSFGLPGARVGWIAVSPDLHDTFLNEVIESSHYTTISVGIINQDIAEFALRPNVRDQIMERSRRMTRENLKIMERWAKVNKDKVTLFRPTGGGTCVIRLHAGNEVIDDAEFVKKLVEHEGAFAPPAGVSFGDQADGKGHTELKGFLRIGLGGESQRLQNGLDAIARLLERWTR